MVSTSISLWIFTSLEDSNLSDLFGAAWVDTGGHLVLAGHQSLN